MTAEMRQWEQLVRRGRDRGRKGKGVGREGVRKAGRKELTKQAH